MSKKSRQRRENREINKQSYNILSVQKETMKKVFLDYLSATVVFFVLSIITFIVGLFTEDVSYQTNIFCATIGIFCFAIIFAFLSLQPFLIFLRIQKIKFSTEQTIEITCKKVKALNHAKTRYVGPFTICFIFTDEKGKKYYAVKGSSPYSKKESGAELLNTKISLVCYANTNFVKTYQIRKSL